MKLMKRVAALLLALLFCVMALPVSAAAQATVSAAKVTAKAGETVEVPISITHIEDIASIGMHIWYDPAVLKCLDAKMSDVVGAMSMANANTEPKGHPNEIWLTAINAEAVVLDGMVMSITFEVLGDAPAGVSPVKVLSEGLSLSARTDLRQLEVDAVDGSVTVEGNGADTPVQSTTTSSVIPTTTDAAQPPVQTTQSKADTPSQTPEQSTTGAENAPATQSSVNEQTITSPNGETIVLPEETVVDIAGNIVTDASGVPTKVPSVAIVVGKATAAPGETVTVKVSLSAVAKLTAIGISVRYDTQALSFEGGECIGFVKDGAGMAAVTENQKGIVEIAATASKGINGSGDIAELRFMVKNAAKNGDYRLSIADDLLMQNNKLELPTKNVAGEIRVEGATEGSASGLYVALGIVAVAVIVAVILWLVLRRKKATAPVEEAPKTPTVVDVSGEENDE